jgi:hypothetical protein
MRPEEMNMDSRHFAKMLVVQGIDCGQTRQDFEEDIAKRSESIRRPGESREQAWTRFATTTDDGRLLFKAAMRAPPMEPPRQAAQDLVREKKPAGPASEELERMARAMAREKNLTYQQAFSRLISDPSRREHLEEIKREEERARRAVSDQRWPLHNAERESRTERWANGDGRVG